MCDCYILFNYYRMKHTLDHYNTAPNCKREGWTSVGKKFWSTWLLPLTNCKSCFYVCFFYTFYLLQNEAYTGSLPHGRHTTPRKVAGISRKEVLE